MEQISTEDYNKLKKLAIINLKSICKLYKVRITDDIIVDGTFHLYKKLKYFNPKKSKLTTYAGVVLKHFFIDNFRKENKFNKQKLYVQDLQPKNYYFDKVDEIDDILAPLSPINKTIVKRRIVDGDTFKKIGKDMGLHSNQVIAKYNKSLKVLKEYENHN